MEFVSGIAFAALIGFIAYKASGYEFVKKESNSGGAGGGGTRPNIREK